MSDELAIAMVICLPRSARPCCSSRGRDWTGRALLARRAAPRRPSEPACTARAGTWLRRSPRPPSHPSRRSLESHRDHRGKRHRRDCRGQPRPRRRAIAHRAGARRGRAGPPARARRGRDGPDAAPAAATPLAARPGPRAGRIGLGRGHRGGRGPADRRQLDRRPGRQRRQRRQRWPAHRAERAAHPADAAGHRRARCPARSRSSGTGCACSASAAASGQPIRGEWHRRHRPRVSGAARELVVRLVTQSNQLRFYDWEANVLTRNGKSVASQLPTRNPTALSISQGGKGGTGYPGAGSMSLYDAVKLAAKQPVRRLAGNLSRMGRSTTCSGPAERRAPRSRERLAPTAPRRPTACSRDRSIQEAPVRTTLSSRQRRLPVGPHPRPRRGDPRPAGHRHPAGRAVQRRGGGSARARSRSSSSCAMTWPCPATTSPTRRRAPILGRAGRDLRFTPGRPAVSAVDA